MINWFKKFLPKKCECEIFETELRELHRETKSRLADAIGENRSLKRCLIDRNQKVTELEEKVLDYFKKIQRQHQILRKRNEKVIQEAMKDDYKDLE